MSTKLKVILFVSTLTCIQAITMLFQIDVWPISNYPMYSSVQSGVDQSALHIEGLADDNQWVRLDGSKYKTIYEALRLAQNNQSNSKAKLILNEISMHLMHDQTNNYKAVRLVKYSFNEGQNTHSKINKEVLLTNTL